MRFQLRLQPTDLIVFLASLLVSGCMSTKSESSDLVQTVTPVVANQHREELDSAKVTMAGWLLIGVDAKCLLQKPYSGKNVPLDEGVTVSYSESMRREVEHLAGRNVEITGTFRKNIMEPDAIMFGACNETAIVVDQIREARANK